MKHHLLIIKAEPLHHFDPLHLTANVVKRICNGVTSESSNVVDLDVDRRELGDL